MLLADHPVKTQGQVVHGIGHRHGVGDDAGIGVRKNRGPVHVIGAGLQLIAAPEIAREGSAKNIVAQVTGLQDRRGGIGDDVAEI